MRVTGLISLLALGLTACGGEAPEADHAMAGHGHSEASAELAPLPDDGVMPVVDVRAVWMRPHPGGRDVTAAYFTARLSEGAIDRLVEARIAGAGRVEMHGHSMNDEGMMQMHQIPPQDVTDAGPLVFTPGGRHLMVFGLDTVVEGDAVEGVLVFERSGEVPVTFQVRNMAPGQVTDY
ncbi:copper chaperone PCu(A)C [Maricaulis sp.]|uniref:copper chaperone PCu(A)C n=1 Tax=Maricaulis sp. TaxID=1486257 RepID=UPI00262D1D82|nr:copper chaperone PCu(A)C [Maricaulis sp.]